MIFVKRYNIFTSEEHNLMHNLMEKIAYAAIAGRKLKRMRLNWQYSWSCFVQRKTTKDKWIICILLSQSHYSSNRRILLGSFQPQSIKAMYVLFMKFICPNNAFKTRVRKMLSIWFYASLRRLTAIRLRQYYNPSTEEAANQRLILPWLKKNKNDAKTVTLSIYFVL